MKVLVGMKEYLKIRGHPVAGAILDDFSFVEKQEQTVNDSINKKHDEFLTQINQTIIPMNKETTIEFCKDWPDPIQEYNNPRNRYERRKLAAESRRRQ